MESWLRKALAGLAAIFENAPPTKPGRHPLCPGTLSYDLVRKRDGSITFLPSVGDVWVSKALRDLGSR